jgi:prolipoprotein diacylglyceryl transferase
MLLDYVIWNVSPEIFHLGPLSVRYYGLFFALAFIIGYRIMNYVYKREGQTEPELDRLALFVVICIVVGARLGHVLFYQPDYYFSHPGEILKVWEGGLASHGAAIALLIGMYIYSRRPVIPSYMWILDRICLTIPIGGFFVRMGNLMNSEIYGVSTKLPWGFVFMRDANEMQKMMYPPEWSHKVFAIVNNLPAGVQAHHPTQIYEAVGYLLIFLLAWAVYKRAGAALKPGRIFGLVVLLIFTLRFIVESIKLEQVDFERGLPLNMGQLLSIPFIIVGAFILIRSYRIADGEKI